MVWLILHLCLAEKALGNAKGSAEEAAICETTPSTGRGFQP